MFKKFECVESCSDCCINRGYFPSKEFGKIGVIILPKERKKIERLAKIKKTAIKILPRIGVGRNNAGEGPEKVIAYQLMGRETDGNICPFLETDGSKKSPHGGALCIIYDERPAACKAYPLVNIDPIISTLDSKCSYCVATNGNKVCNLGLNDEIMALNEIMISTRAGENDQLWRYATNVGDSSDGKMMPEGWVQTNTDDQDVH